MSIVHAPAEIDAARTAFQTALSQARVHGAPVVLNARVPGRTPDPWRLVDAWASHPAFLAWSDPRGDLTMVALGDAGVASDDGSGGFEPVAHHCSRPQELDWAQPAPPPTFVGFSFSGRAPSGVWSGWPAALAVAPRLTVIQRGRHTPEAIVRIEVRHGDRFEEVAAAVARAASDLAAADRVGPRQPSEVLPQRRPVETRGAFEARVALARDAVRLRAVEKLVPARACDLEPPAGHEFDVPRVLRHLRDAEPSAIVYAVAGPGGAVLAGATPEVLARVSAGRVDTHALAGTAARTGDARADAAAVERLLASAKDRDEHAVVATRLRAALQALCTTVDAAPAPRVARLGGLLHLETPVRGTLCPGVGLLEVARALHPTPAVAGAPREDALAWLERHEPDRGWFAAPLGWIDPAGEGVLAVVLRCALIRSASARVWAGAGVVADSDPVAEWLETEHKLGTMTRALAAGTVRS